VLQSGNRGGGLNMAWPWAVGGPTPADGSGNNRALMEISDDDSEVTGSVDCREMDMSDDDAAAAPSSAAPMEVDGGSGSAGYLGHVLQQLLTGGPAAAAVLGALGAPLPLLPAWTYWAQQDVDPAFAKAALGAMRRLEGVSVADLTTTGLLGFAASQLASLQPLPQSHPGAPVPGKSGPNKCAPCSYAQSMEQGREVLVPAASHQVDCKTPTAKRAGARDRSDLFRHTATSTTPSRELCCLAAA
jgi:hypothetical protein